MSGIPFLGTSTSFAVGAECELSAPTGRPLHYRACHALAPTLDAVPAMIIKIQVETET